MKRSVFRDPAALPMLRGIANGLRAKGYDVTEPKPGKACHGFCRVTLPHIEISIVMLVRRRKRKIEFEILTWPSQSLRQRISFPAMNNPDCPEWADLCTAIHTIVIMDLRAESVTLRTRAEADAAAED